MIHVASYIYVCTENILKLTSVKANKKFKLFHQAVKLTAGATQQAANLWNSAIKMNIHLQTIPFQLIGHYR